MKIGPFDAEFNSASNPSRFRNNPSRIANPDKKKPNLVLTLPTSKVKKYEDEATTNHVTCFVDHLSSQIENKANVLGQLLNEWKSISE